MSILDAKRPERLAGEDIKLEKRLAEAMLHNAASKRITSRTRSRALRAEPP